MNRPTLVIKSDLQEANLRDPRSVKNSLSSLTTSFWSQKLRENALLFADGEDDGGGGAGFHHLLGAVQHPAGEHIYYLRSPGCGQKQWAHNTRAV